jgi:predicted ArsR family transcriptional regulator
MQTVKEVAEELDISTQAVYKKLNQLQTELNNHIHEVAKGNKTVKAVDRKGIEIIKDSLVKPVDQQVCNQVGNQLQVETMEILRETIDTLKNQMDKKDKEIQQLKEDYKEQLKSKDRQIENLTELNRNNQILLGRGQEQKALPGGTVIDKIKNFFNKED